MFARKALGLFVGMLLTCNASIAWAAPAFKGVFFGKHSTRCDSGNARGTTSPDGSAISVIFDQLQAEAGAAKHSHDRMRCDLTLKLTSPVIAPTKVLLDVRGAINKTGKATVLFKVLVNGIEHSLSPDSTGPVASSFITTLPEDAKKLPVSFVVSAKGKYPYSSALVSIDSVEATFYKEEINHGNKK